MNRVKRMVRDLLQEEGCKIVEQVHNCHLKTKFRTPGGNTALLVTSGSSTEQFKMQRRVIQRLIEEKDSR